MCFAFVSFQYLASIPLFHMLAIFRLWSEYHYFIVFYILNEASIMMRSMFLDFRFLILSSFLFFNVFNFEYSDIFEFNLVSLILST